MCAVAKNLALKIIVILAYVTAFIIVHWLFYLPMFPQFTWVGIDTPWDVSKNSLAMGTTIVGVIAVVTITLMAVWEPERMRDKLVMHEVRSLISKKRKQSSRVTGKG